MMIEKEKSKIENIDMLKQNIFSCILKNLSNKFDRNIDTSNSLSCSKPEATKIIYYVVIP